jgi:excisionase family DNA binding protein
LKGHDIEPFWVAEFCRQTSGENGPTAFRQNAFTPKVTSTKERSAMQGWLKIRDVSEYTGLSVSALYTLVSKRQIPYGKAGRLLRFKREDIDSWLKRHTDTSRDHR